jgi:hypothetical protein
VKTELRKRLIAAKLAWHDSHGDVVMHDNEEAADRALAALGLDDAVCGFCQGKPVGNAATWVDGKPRLAAPCPRCGVVTPYPEADRGRGRPT